MWSCRILVLIPCYYRYTGIRVKTAPSVFPFSSRSRPWVFPSSALLKNYFRTATRKSLLHLIHSPFYWTSAERNSFSHTYDNGNWTALEPFVSHLAPLFPFRSRAPTFWLEKCPFFSGIHALCSWFSWLSGMNSLHSPTPIQSFRFAPRLDPSEGLIYIHIHLIFLEKCAS